MLGGLGFCLNVSICSFHNFIFFIVVRYDGVGG
jgi:hypothetical protein